VPGPWVDDDLRSLIGVTVDASPTPGAAPGVAKVRFRLDHPLGEGGTGVAFLAMRITEEGDSPHVVKVFRPMLLLKAPEIAEVSRRKEHTAMRRLNERVPPSPYIVRLIDTGDIDVTYKEAPVVLPWIASEYINGGLEGTTLTERIARAIEATGVSFEPERVLRAMRCITEGIAAIHEVGVIHRDIKPDNILLCGFAEDEISKITDFGVAKATGLEMTFGPQPVGTIGYAAPEQLGLLQAPTTEATDVFALGVLLYKMLAADDYFRRVPFAQLATRRDDGATTRARGCAMRRASTPSSRAAGPTSTTSTPRFAARRRCDRRIASSRRATSAPRSIRRCARSCARPRPRGDARPRASGCAPS